MHPSAAPTGVAIVSKSPGSERFVAFTTKSRRQTSNFHSKARFMIERARHSRRLEPLLSRKPVATMTGARQVG